MKFSPTNMTCCSDQTFADLDWVALRANALAKKGWQNKGPKEWDNKAGSFAARNKNAAYVELFLAHLPLEPTMTVLDIGSGPGTLAIPIARKVQAVTAIDFSRTMLEVLKEQAEQEQLTNIKTVHCAWEDDWQAQGIAVHDIAIASRALGVKDLATALKKIDAYGSRYVFLSDRIGATPFDRGAFTALGRPFAAGPDYIYTVNMLYTLGIHPNLAVLTLEREVTYPSMEEALRSYSWMFQDITAAENLALENYISGKIVNREGNSLTVRRDQPPRWALIWWQKS